jgi:DNA-binding transcriptional regulator YhcF (GntR family)
MSLITVKENLGIPKYKQIIISIENALQEGSLKKGDKIPSINSIRNKFSLSRDTVLKAYNVLKLRGIIQSIAGKGYYIKSENITVKQKIFLLFDELNSFKEDLYNSFLNNLDDNTQVDIFFHHFNFSMFSKLINDSIGNYNSYIIMPANFDNSQHIIKNLPKEKVYILDQTHHDIAHYSTVYQDFENAIYNNLNIIYKQLTKYHKITLLFQKNKQPKGMLLGFEKFCETTNFKSDVINSIENITPEKNDIFLIPDDKNLILLIKKIKEENLKIGKNIGVISYNDSLLKEIVEGGITTISTNFTKMGKTLAQMILSKKNIKIENPTTLTLRKSI